MLDPYEAKQRATRLVSRGRASPTDLQGECTALVDTAALFSGYVESFPPMSSHLFTSVTVLGLPLGASDLSFFGFALMNSLGYSLLSNIPGLMQ